MNAQTDPNPLAQFYRREAFTISLPSNGLYYDESLIALNEAGEVGILPMTATDEITLKNPDALLTGKAIISVINSCVPAIKDPKKLLACDIDSLMIAIRRASYGEEADMNITCPECEEENTFALDLEMLLNQTEKLDPPYEVVLPQGLTVFLQPGTFDTTTKQNKAVFENRKVQRALTNPAVSDEAALSLLSQTFSSLTKLNFELVVDSIDKIVFTTEDGEEKEITSKKHISEFIKNIDKKSVDIIDKKLSEINKIGIAKTVDAVCKECGHTWKAPLEFNPVNFS